jgi:hypothetical protein
MSRAIGFQAFSKPLFAARPGAPADRAGRPLYRRDCPRRMAALAEAKDILPCLPGTGQACHFLMTGRYDLMHLLLVVLESRPGPVDHLRIATLSFNKKNLGELLQLLDSGKVKRLSFVFSKFFKEQTSETYLLAAAALRQRGQRFAAPRSHAKVICCQWPGPDRLVMEGSANLRSNGNQEQLSLFTDLELHDWHAAWIDATLDKHAIEEGQEGG